jgi:protease-4
MAQSIVASGRTTRAALDSVVNHEPILLPGDVLARGWVDRLGHWEDLQAVAQNLRGGKKLSRLSSKTLARIRWRPEEEWGTPPVVSLVYTLGDCAMDTGIKGRTTSRALRAIGKNSNVKAVVIRVDSPGGDPLPCDLVANEMMGIRARKKPVFVSQGRVAASGGYWLSMDADSIFVSPFTVAGSIGVIGGWFWNDGLGKKLGLTSDRVQIGKSADLLGGVTLPLLELTVPERNLDTQERELAKRTILGEYDAFTKHVAGARKLDVAYVRTIAEGHVYPGREGIEKRIVDRVATLDETIAAAKVAAGIKPGRRVRVVEYPTQPLIRWPRLLPVWPGLRGAVTASADSRADWGPISRALGERSYESWYLDRVLAQPGVPLALTPDGLLPDESPAF